MVVTMMTLAMMCMDDIYMYGTLHLPALAPEEVEHAHGLRAPKHEAVQL